MSSRERFTAEFDAWAATYDETVAVESDVFQGYPAVLDAVAGEATVQPSGSVTEIGAGTGNLTQRLCAGCRTVTAVEPSAAMRRELALKLPDVLVLPGDFLHLPAALPPQHTFVASFSFHHVPPGQRRRALRVLVGALAPGGRIVIADVAFAGPQVRQRIFREVEQAGRSDLLRNLRAEFYPTVDIMLAAMQDAGLTAAARQLTPWVWLFTAQPGAPELGLRERVPRPIHGLQATE